MALTIEQQKKLIEDRAKERTTNFEQIKKQKQEKTSNYQRLLDEKAKSLPSFKNNIKSAGIISTGLFSLGK